MPVTPRTDKPNRLPTVLCNPGILRDQEDRDVTKSYFQQTKGFLMFVCMHTQLIHL